MELPDERAGAAFVTGTSTGIGFATAVRLARAGYEVVAGMRDPAQAGELLSAAAGGRLRAVALDVDDSGSVASAFEEAGPVDVLVNNAGICPFGPVEEMPLADWKSVFETNVFGVVRCIQAALPAMRERGRGHIVNISSASTICTPPGAGAYTASKAALEKIAEALAAEVGPFGIKVSTLQVGAVKTAMQAKALPPRTEIYRHPVRNGMLLTAYLHGEASSPEVIARAVEAVLRPNSDVHLNSPAGHGAIELQAIAAELSVDERRRLFALPTTEFLSAWLARTGQDLSRR